jgi:uncharacterized membrane protein
MLSSVNVWMCLAGLIFFIAGVFMLRKEISAARGWNKLITVAPVFIAVSLAMFAPEHFRGPMFVQNMVPSWMPGPHSFWAYFVGCALLAAATSLTFRKFLRLSSTLLGLMFFLFVCMLYLPGVLRHPGNRFAWTYLLRDASFAAGAWALAGLYIRASSQRQSEWLILFSRIIIAIAAVFFGTQHFLHPAFAPGVPLELHTPSWVPLPRLWAYLSGAVLLLAGICLALNKQSRMAAASVGTLMTILTLFLYLPILLLAIGGSPDGINEAINYVADTLLYAGSALALASALPGGHERAKL